MYIEYVRIRYHFKITQDTHTNTTAPLPYPLVPDMLRCKQGPLNLRPQTPNLKSFYETLHSKP